MTDHNGSAGPRFGSGRLPAAFTTPGSSSFTEFMASLAPNERPDRFTGLAAAPEVPHATTIVALTWTRAKNMVPKAAPTRASHRSWSSDMARLLSVV